MNDDLISRKKAINAMCDNCDTVAAKCAHFPCERFLAMEQLPSADVPDTDVGDMISRQAAIGALDGEIIITGRINAEAIKAYVRLVKDRLERLPSAEPQIVRCVDCKRAYGWTTMQGLYGGLACEQLDRDVDDNFFCAYGERRTYETD